MINIKNFKPLLYIIIVVTSILILSTPIDTFALITECEDYYRVLFSEDFENERNLRQRTDLWSFGGATVDAVEDAGTNGSRVAMLLEEHGKTLRINPLVIDENYESPSFEMAKTLEKVRIECDIKLDEGASVMLRFNNYAQPTNSIILAHLKEGYIYLYGNESEVMSTYTPNCWYSYRIDIDAKRKTFDFYQDGQIIRTDISMEHIVDSGISLDGVLSFSIYGRYNTTDRYIYADNIRFLSTSAEPIIGVDRGTENRGKVSYFLVPDSKRTQKSATLVLATMKDNKLIDLKLQPAETQDKILKLELDYLLNQDETLKAFVLDNLNNITPITDSVSVRAVTNEDFGLIKQKWRQYLCGDENIDLSNSYISSIISGINYHANRSLNRMNLDFDSPVLFGPSVVTSTTEMTGQYNALWRLALAYGTYGTQMYQDDDIKNKIFFGLEWLYQNLYGQNEIYGTGWKSTTEYNWYDWFSATPSYLVRILMVMEPHMQKTDILKYLSLFDHLTTWMRATNSYSDSVSRIYSSLALAVLKEDSHAIEQRIEEDLLRSILPVVSGNGYQEDYMYIFHGYFPYSGGYGINTLNGSILPVLSIINGTKFDLDSTVKYNIAKYMYNTYEPVLFRGNMPSMLMGRSIESAEEKYEGLQVIRAAVDMLGMFSEDDDIRLGKLIKRNVTDENRDYIINAMTIDRINKLLNVLNDDTIPEDDGYTDCRVYYTGDRVMQQRNDYAIGIAMSSSRTKTYESINGVNKKGWFTSDGMTYMYNKNSSNQFTCEYWNNVNMSRLAGTTEDIRQREEISIANTHAYFPTPDFVGGVEFNNEFAVVGMDFEAFNNDEEVDYIDRGYGGANQLFDSTLVAKKAWFLFDDEVVALGAGINSNDNADVNTYIENRMLDGMESVIIDDVQETQGAYQKTIVDPTWLHVSGVAGYYFPSECNLTINKDETEKSFLEMWVEHGKNPINENYSYVLLPSKTSEETVLYATDPDIDVLVNTPQLQVVTETKINLTGMIFWQAGSFENITVSKPLILMIKEKDGEYILKMSDPTHELEQATVIINKSLDKVFSSDTVQVTTNAATTVVNLDLSDSKGETHTAIFTY